MEHNTFFRGSDYMKRTFDGVISKKEQQEIRELVSVLLLLPESDRMLIASNVNILKSRQDIEKARKGRGA